MHRALAILCLVLSGCASVPYPPPERTFFYHEKDQLSAWNKTAEWVKAAPEFRTWSIAGSTGSMRPAINGGEFLMLLRYTEGMEILPGQIVVFERDTLHVLHRVILGGGSSGAVFIKGDNCAQADGWISKQRIRFICVGVVTFP